MVTNIVKKSDLTSPVIIHNRTVARAEAFASTLPSEKVTIAKTLEEGVAKSDVIFSCVGDDAAVREIYAQFVANDVKGKLFVDCSTIHPDTTEELETMIEKKGGMFVAMPVFGAPAMADGGQLICVLAGKKDAVDKVKPYTKGV